MTSDRHRTPALSVARGIVALQLSAAASIGLLALVYTVASWIQDQRDPGSWALLGVVIGLEVLVGAGAVALTLGLPVALSRHPAGVLLLLAAQTAHAVVAVAVLTDPMGLDEPWRTPTIAYAVVSSAAVAALLVHLGLLAHRLVTRHRPVDTTPVARV